MNQQNKMRNVKIYNIDVTTTDDCNFRCTYCFEHGYFHKNYFSKVDLLVQRLNELLNSNFFTKNYDMLNIGFWGGEPTLHEKMIKYLVGYYKDNDRVKYFIFSNGFNIDPFINMLEYFSGYMIEGHPKLCIQMSYDGNPIQEMCRRTKDNKPTSEIVRNNIIKLFKKKIPTVIKSTVSLETVKYLPQARRDMLDLVENTVENNFFKNSNYFPTIDYYHLNNYTEEEIEQYYKELKESLIEIARDEIEYYKKNNNFFFSWFIDNKALCSAGRDMVCVNWDGNIFKCHGAIYEDSSGDHFITSLEDNNFIDKLIDSYNLHGSNFMDQSDECKECLATFCLRCNSVKFDYSKKQTYIGRWRDYDNQPRLCKFFKLNGNIVYAIKEILQMEK